MSSWTFEIYFLLVTNPFTFTNFSLCQGHYWRLLTDQWWSSRRRTSYSYTTRHAYYQELLGISVAMLLSYTSNGLLQLFLSNHSCHSSTLPDWNGHMAPYCWEYVSYPASLMWTESHPERRKPQSAWTANDWNINIADAIAGTSDGIRRSDGPPYLLLRRQPHSCSSYPSWDMAMTTWWYSF